MKNKNLVVTVVKAVVILIFSFVIFTVEIGTVMSGSMIPSININEHAVYFKYYPLSKVQVEDIVVYEAKDLRYIIHRVNTIRYNDINGKIERELQVKGDNNIMPDSTYVNSTNYVGKVLFVIKNEKINTFMLAFAKLNKLTKLGIAFACIAAWIALTEIVNYVSKITTHRIDNSSVKNEAVENSKSDKENNNEETGNL